MTWINRRGKYPFVDPQVWVTRYWLLRRKITKQAGFATPCDRRVAAELLAFAEGRGRCGAPKHLVTDLREAVLNGPDPNPYSPEAEEGLGAE